MNDALERSDRLARQRALDPTTSFIVQAPAGSGKTELLIQRFLALLARVQAPEEVVAITFTRKAAARCASACSMRSRLRSAASRRQSDQRAHHPRTRAERALHADAAHAWGLVDNPGAAAHPDHRLRCACRWRAQMPLLSRMGAMPSPVDDAWISTARPRARRWRSSSTAQWTAAGGGAAVASGQRQSARARRCWRACSRDAINGCGMARCATVKRLTRAFVSLIVERMQQVCDLMPARHCARADRLHALRGRATSISPIRSRPSLRAARSAQYLRRSPSSSRHGVALRTCCSSETATPRLKVNVSVGFPAAREQGVDAHELRRRDEAKRRMEGLLSDFADSRGIARSAGRGSAAARSRDTATSNGV